jgi:putative endopeptidase
MDLTVSPADNFFQYASGAWMKENPIPTGYPAWNTFTALSVQSQENLRVLLDDLILKQQQSKNTAPESDAPATPSVLSVDEAKVATFYAAALDEEAIEHQGIFTPLQPLLTLIDETVAALEEHQQDPSSGGSAVAFLLGQFPGKYGVFPFFSVGASPDNTNSKHVLCQLSQGGLGLPDRDYYFDDDKAEKRTLYQEHVALMLTLLATAETAAADNKEPEYPTAPTEDARTIAAAIYKIEETLAAAHMTKTENRDPQATYNKMTIVTLVEEQCREGAFDFGAYLHAATHGKELGEINVRNVAAIQCVAKLWTTIQPDLLRAYLRWCTVRSMAPYLTKAMVQSNFDFFERVLSGTAEIKPRWKRAMAFTETALGEVLGQLYCAKHFDESCKERALDIVQAVRKSLEERLQEVEWMTSEATRQAALQKMASFSVKIGYPDKWIDYSTLQFRSGSCFLHMVWQARAFEHQRTVDEMNAPTDRNKWFMTPQTVNAYYHPSLNEIVFPAAILQPPFFNPTADDPVNFGSMAAVCGHEMTHGFDDKGRKFNTEGNMIDWWTPEDAAEYEKRVDVMVQQANEYAVHGQHVQGKLTCGENIADLGGLRLALRALRSTPGFDPSQPVVDGFTPMQRFFLGWAQCWRQNVTVDRALQLLTIDPHGPNEMRCNGPLSNMPEFHEAFGVPTGSPMFRALEKRVDIW